MNKKTWNKRNSYLKFHSKQGKNRKFAKKKLRVERHFRVPFLWGKK